MNPEISGSTRRNIRNFLTVLASACALGLLTAAFFVLYYSPNENYLAKNTLISPSTASLLRISYPNEMNKPEPFSLSTISFSYRDNSKIQDVKKIIPLNSYQKFYELVGSDVSDKELFSYFQGRLAGVIEIRVKNPTTEDSERVLQLVEFSEDGNYYRVELFQAEGDETWGYFKHPEIFQKTLALFNVKP